MKNQSTISFEFLKNQMGTHSNNTINHILTFTEETFPEKTEEIKEMIGKNINSFLNQKAAILSEYKEGDDNGDTYLFENREKYRQNIGGVIRFVLEQDREKQQVSEQAETSKKALIEILNNNFR